MVSPPVHFGHFTFLMFLMSKWVDHDDHGVTTCRHVLRRRCPRSLPCSSGCILMQKSTSVPRCGLDGTNWICPVETIDFRRSSGFATWILHLDMDGYGIYGICQYTHIWYIYIHICIYMYIYDIYPPNSESLGRFISWLMLAHCTTLQVFLQIADLAPATKNSSHWVKLPGTSLNWTRRFALPIPVGEMAVA
jgi:hypothetical protein